MKKLILFVSKIIIGLLILNMSIIADAVNNLSDFASCVISLFGFKMSGKPADKNSPLIMIGGDETYEARCIKCYELPNAHPELNKGFRLLQFDHR